MDASDGRAAGRHGNYSQSELGGVVKQHSQRGPVPRPVPLCEHGRANRETETTRVKKQTGLGGGENSCQMHQPKDSDSGGVSYCSEPCWEARQRSCRMPPLVANVRRANPGFCNTGTAAIEYRPGGLADQGTTPSATLFALAQSIVSNHAETHYSYAIHIDPTVGVYDTDCSGFVDYLLKRSRPTPTVLSPRNPVTFDRGPLSSRSSSLNSPQACRRRAGQQL